MPLEIVRNDITSMRVDAVVNSANPHPIVGGGVDRAIHAKAGAELLAARKKIGDIATGKAFITPAFHLSAKYVIHTVGPVWQDGKRGERELLAKCYENSLHLASEHHCASVAFPLISAGVFGCPAEVAIATATKAIRDFLQEREMDVYLVVFDRDSFKISSSLFRDVKSYLDEMYVSDALEEEYRGDDRERRVIAMMKPEPMPNIPVSTSAPPKWKFAWKKKPGSYDESLRRNLPPASHAPHISAAKSIRSQAAVIEDLLNDADATFSETLLTLIDAKGKTDPEIYKRANVDRRHFSKIRNTPAYQPSKSTALALAVALELTIDETRDFIGRAGYTISHSSKMDIIVEYFISRREYDIFTINETLFAFGQPCLG